MEDESSHILGRLNVRSLSVLEYHWSHGSKTGEWTLLEGDDALLVGSASLREDMDDWGFALLAFDLPLLDVLQSCYSILFCTFSFGKHTLGRVSNLSNTWEVFHIRIGYIRWELEEEESHNVNPSLMI